MSNWKSVNLAYSPGVTKQSCVPYAQWGQINWNVGVWSRERFIARPNKENGWLMLKNPELLHGFGGKVFIGKMWGKGWRVCDFLLIGWWWGDRVVFQESCAQPEVTILHLGGGLGSAKELYNIVMYIPWGAIRTLPQSCTIVSSLLLPCFCIPSFPWLVTVWTCPLELREGQGDWMKPISYKQGTEDTEKICT